MSDRKAVGTSYREHVKIFFIDDAMSMGRAPTIISATNVHLKNTFIDWDYDKRDCDDQLFPCGRVRAKSVGAIPSIHGHKV